MSGTMFRFTSVLLAAVAAGSFLGGCSSAQKDELAMLKEENAQLAIQRDEARSALESSEAERRRLEQENGSLQARSNEQPPAVNATPVAPGPKLDLPEGVTAENRNGTMVLTIEGDVLFDSGKATLKPDAKKTLDKVISELKKKYPTNKLRLAGFTDTDPIKKSGFKTNYHLGFERSFSVGQYLSTKGIEEARIEYSSFGPNAPKQSKKESRRVEIAIVNN
ncbi:MAG: putative lipoprotein YiaD precursor [Planctomycetota bacterium]|jgi:flagellar motor protein MotB